MNRRYMAADDGMLFEFDRDAPVAFWMKNTYIPLDMIFISRAGIVTNVVADAEPSVGARHSVRAALRGGARGQWRRRGGHRGQGRR